MEYKAERASMPTRFTLICLILTFKDLQLCNTDEAISHLQLALKYASDRESFDIQSIIDNIKNGGLTVAMNTIEAILTCDGRIYDEFSEFLKLKQEGSENLHNWFTVIKDM